MALQQMEISGLIDRPKVSPYQWFIIALCAAVVFMDGFDAQAIGYVAPAVIKDWGLQRPQLGPVFSMGLVGLMLGALFIAPLADRIGRRPLILISTTLFGVFTLATAWAQDLDQLLILRFLTGLGLGGSMPNAIAITSEFSPAHRRSLLVMVMFSGFTLGSLTAGLLSAELIPDYGWRSIFVIGGVLPLVLVAVIFTSVPESIRYLVASKAPGARIAKVVRRVAPDADVDENTVFVIEEAAAKRMSVRQLLTDGRARRTILLWIVFFMSLLDAYLLVNWLPTAMDAAGAPVRTAILVGVILQVGAFIGAFPLGYMLDRFGARAAIFPAYLLAALSIPLIGVFATSSIPLTMLVVFLAGFGVIGGQTAANAVAAESYPTEIRSTGVGWCLGVGRVGSIIGPAVAGVLLGLDVSIRDIFFLSTIPAAIAALAGLGLKPWAYPRSKGAAVLAH